MSTKAAWEDSPINAYSFPSSESVQPQESFPERPPLSEEGMLKSSRDK